MSLHSNWVFVGEWFEVKSKQNQWLKNKEDFLIFHFWRSLIFALMNSAKMRKLSFLTSHYFYMIYLTLKESIINFHLMSTFHFPLVIQSLSLAIWFEKFVSLPQFCTEASILDFKSSFSSLEQISFSSCIVLSQNYDLFLQVIICILEFQLHVLKIWKVACWVSLSTYEFLSLFVLQSWYFLAFLSIDFSIFSLDLSSTHFLF